MGDWDLADLRNANPLIAGASVQELLAAMEEIDKSKSGGLDSIFKKWMKGKTEMALGKIDIEWRPLSELRFRDMRFGTHTSGKTFIFANGIDAFQVIINTEYIHSYHIQSMVSGELIGYFVIKNGKPFLVTNWDLLGLNAKKVATSSIRPEEGRKMRDKGMLSPIKDEELPLHQMIFSKIFHFNL